MDIGEEMPRLYLISADYDIRRVRELTDPVEHGKDSGFALHVK